MSAPVDVVGILNHYIEAFSDDERHDQARELTRVRDAAIELLAADREYDRAKQAKYDAVAVAGMVQQRDTDRAFQAARKRRAAAIMAFGSPK